MKKNKADDVIRDKNGNIEYEFDDRPFDMRPEPPDIELSDEEIKQMREQHIKLGLKD